MPLSITHYLEYVIEFKESVDLFDVIYQLKIQTRNDFEGNKKKITICRLSPHTTWGRMLDDPVHRFANSEFIKKYVNIWNNYDRIVYTGFEINFKNYEEKYKEEYIEKHNNLNGFEEKYNNIINISNELEKECDNIKLTEEEVNLIDSVNEFPGLKENISFIGWKDCWICY